MPPPSLPLSQEREGNNPFIVAADGRRARLIRETVPYNLHRRLRLYFGRGVPFAVKLIREGIKTLSRNAREPHAAARCEGWRKRVPAAPARLRFYEFASYGLVYGPFGARRDDGDVHPRDRKEELSGGPRSDCRSWSAESRAEMLSNFQRSLACASLGG